LHQLLWIVPAEGRETRRSFVPVRWDKKAKQMEDRSDTYLYRESFLPFASSPSSPSADRSSSTVVRLLGFFGLGEAGASGSGSVLGPSAYSVDRSIETPSEPSITSGPFDEVGVVDDELMGVGVGERSGEGIFALTQGMSERPSRL